jgi:hypothetical protein
MLPQDGEIIAVVKLILLATSRFSRQKRIQVCDG